MSGEAVHEWAISRQFEAPPFSGGVLDSWPAWAVDAFAVLDAESKAVRGFLDATATLEAEKQRAARKTENENG